MNQAIAEQWINTLESDKYTQATGHLVSEDGYCCLGVLCKIAEPILNIGFWNPADLDAPTDEEITGLDIFVGDTELLPREVTNWAGMKTDDGFLRLETKRITLAHLNDNGKTFKEIAQIIRENVEIL